MDTYVIGTVAGEYAIIKKGSSPKTTHKLSEAKIFQDKLSAMNSIKALPKSMLTIGDWHPILIDELIDSVEQNNTYKEIDINEVASGLNQQMTSIKAMVGNKKLLGNALKELELIILDIRHYIEFNELNAADGYKAYKICRTALKKRREIKDQLDTINFFETAKVTELINGGMEKKLSVSSKRCYKTRTKEVEPLFTMSTLNKDVFTKVCDNIRKII